MPAVRSEVHRNAIIGILSRAALRTETAPFIINMNSSQSLFSAAIVTCQESPTASVALSH